MGIPLKCDLDDILLAYGEACMKIRLLEAQVTELQESLGGSDGTSNGSHTMDKLQRTGLSSEGDEPSDTGRDRVASLPDS